ncbi:TetR/AcrR family transcriptional regulator [Actinomadura parmotrematis]|uniref:TetR/AcrR family transcriptional regulator n=1 Tax=Actinomadura parmotrematis TaxID=2864039 RepID=A0ABS7G1E8_9ACTN|nr:TetR/AcrR family transcriptional regulator [Actinomadura parmotrematis]MBW8485483.1 TetR/AcrR family transcriptional regulator [Actinomadura parmotrematis]
MDERQAPGPARGYRRLPSGRRREEIVAAAIATFSVDHDASLSDIAASAGISRTSLYRYFETRHDLVTAAFATAGDLLMEYVDDAPDGPPSLALCVRLGRFFDYIQTNATTFVGMVTWNSPMASREIQAIAQGVRDRLCASTFRVLRVAEPSPLLETAVRTWIAGVEEAAMQWLRSSGADRGAVEALLAANLGTALLNTATYDAAALDLVRWWLRTEPGDAPFAAHLRAFAGTFDLTMTATIARLLAPDPPPDP